MKTLVASLGEAVSVNYKNFSTQEPQVIPVKVPIIYDSLEQAGHGFKQATDGFVLKNHKGEDVAEGTVVWRVPEQITVFWNVKGEFPLDAQKYEHYNAIPAQKSWDLDVPEEYEQFTSWYDESAEGEVDLQVERKIYFEGAGQPRFTETKPGMWRVEQDYKLLLRLRVQ